MHTLSSKHTRSWLLALRERVSDILSKFALASLVVVLCWWTLAAPQLALAATMTDLGTLPGGEFSTAQAVNDAGQVVGYATVTGGAYHAFIWQSGAGMTDLGTLGGADSYAESINSAGQVVGYSTAADGATHAFIWQTGVMTDLHTLLGGSIASWAYGINDTGQIVGFLQTTVDSGYGFIWHNGVITDLGTLPGYAYSVPSAINSAGQVVGAAMTAGGTTRAFVWHTGVMTDLGTLGGTNSYAHGINSAGQVVGEAQNAGGKTRAFLWEGGPMADLGSLGNDSSRAYGINDAGQIVGNTNILGGPNVHAFLWEENMMIDLGTLGGYTSGAEDINNVGQVVGSSTVTGPSHAFFMDVNCSDTLTVTSTADSGAGSLRQAIADVCWGGTVTFAGDLSGATIPLSSTLTFAKPQTIDGAVLAAPIALSGDSNGDGTGDVRVLSVDAGISVTLKSLTIVQGQAPVAGNGGGLLNKGTVTLLDSTFLSNTASWGGGIQNEGALTVISGTFSANTAAQGGAFHNAAAGVTTVSDSTFSGNTASADGGGLVNSGQLTVTDSVFSDNEAANGGGGLKNVSALLISGTTFITNTASSAGGGGIENYGDSLTVTHSTFTDNAALWGGGLYNDGSGTAAITGSTFADNRASSQGGGLVNYSTLTVAESTFAGNTASSGGGIGNVNDALAVTGSTFSANTATDYGGGLYNSAGTVTVAASTFVSNTAARQGGGLYTNGGTATVNASTFAFNRITWGSYNGYGGGGLYNTGGTLTVRNSTFASNEAPFNSGGGLFNAGPTTVQASTFSGNSADYGGGIWNESGNLELRQTIVANSGAGHDCGKGMFSGYVFSVASLFEATGGDACGSDHYGSILGVDPLLGPLADNGGSIPTLALLPNSPAIDTASGWTCLPTDGRGLPRADLSCDIGAFELQFEDSDTVVKTFAGNVSHSFGPTWVSVTLAMTDTGALTVTKHMATPGGVWNTGEISATWWIESRLSAGLPATLSFCYTDAEVAGLDEATLQAFRWEGGQWIAQSSAPDPASNCVTVGGVSAFSAWTLAVPPAPTAARVVGLAAQGFAPVAALIALGCVALLRRRR